MEQSDLEGAAEALGPLSADRPIVQAADLAARAEQRWHEGAAGAAGDLAGRALSKANSDEGYWRGRARLEEIWQEDDLLVAEQIWLGRRREALAAEAEVLKLAEFTKDGAATIMRVASDGAGVAPPSGLDEERERRVHLEAQVHADGLNPSRFARMLGVVAGTGLVVADLGSVVAGVVLVPVAALGAIPFATASVGAGLGHVSEAANGA